MSNLTNKYTLSINVRLAPVYFSYFLKDYWFKCEYCYTNVLFISQDATFIYTHVYIEPAIGSRHLVGAPWIAGSRRQSSAGDCG